jgi:hypothetical protein
VLKKKKREIKCNEIQHFLNGLVACFLGEYNCGGKTGPTGVSQPSKWLFFMQTAKKKLDVFFLIYKKKFSGVLNFIIFSFQNISHKIIMSTSTPKSTVPPDLEPITRTDTLVQTYKGKADESPELTRVVLICLDPESAEITFEWALENFIVSQKDLVSWADKKVWGTDTNFRFFYIQVILVHVREIDIPVAPYINSTGFVDDVSEERREESHHLLRVFAEELNKKKVSG